MAVDITKRMTATEFDAFALRPDNSGRVLEYIGGEVIEVPSNPYVSKIAARIITLIGMFLLQNDIGHLTGEAGGYQVSGERYAPDVAFISYQKQPELARKGYNPNPPDLAVEVISDPDNSEEQTQLRLKLTSYLAAGVLVWIVNPHTRVVEVHQAGQPPRVIDENGTLDGGEVLPGCQLAVRDIFPESPVV